MRAPTNAALSAGPGRSSELVSTMGVMRLLSVVLERTAKKNKAEVPVAEVLLVAARELRVSNVLLLHGRRSAS